MPSPSAHSIQPISPIFTPICPIGFAVLGYSIWRSDVPIPRRAGMPDWLRKLALTVGQRGSPDRTGVRPVRTVSRLLQPGIRSVEPWTASHTPIWSYLTHWGVFLFIITGWLAWETRQWLASTPRLVAEQAASVPAVDRGRALPSSWWRRSIWRIAVWRSAGWPAPGGVGRRPDAAARLARRESALPSS